MSSSQGIYLLDANVFIEAAKHYYAFDLVGSFWNELVNKAEEGHIESIDKVKLEIDNKKDKLQEWADGNFLPWFRATGQTDVLNAYGKIMRWADDGDFSDKAKKDFADQRKADAWIVAYAITKRCVVVTHEQHKPDAKHKIPIPNVCHTFGIRYLNTFQMLRELNITLG